MNDDEKKERHIALLDGGEQIKIEGKFVLYKFSGNGEIDFAYSNMQLGEKMHAGFVKTEGRFIYGIISE